MHICMLLVNLLRLLMKGGISMAHLFKIKVATSAGREVNVVAETPEEANGKVTLAEGETVIETVDAGEVVA